MSIRLRLLLTNTIMLVITILIFLTTAFLVTTAVTGDVRSVKQFYRIHLSLDPLNAAQENIFQELKYVAKNDPDQLLNPETLKEWEYKLRVERASLLIRHEDRTLLDAPSLDAEGLASHLPAYEMDNLNIRDTFTIGDRFFAYGKFDYYYGDRSKGSLFVIREVSPFTALVGKLLPVLISLLFVLLVGANILLYWYVTRSIVKPLSLLRASAARIKEGDLDFRVRPSTQNEMGQLLQAFEEMRLKLKESVELRMRYEDNRNALISDISHDLKTPITTIKGYVEGIRDGVAGTKDKMDKYMETIYGKAVEMDRLIDELFLYSKLNLKKVPFDFRRIDVRRFLTDIAEELRFDLERQSIRLRWPDEHGTPVFAIVDPEKLRRVVGNVVSNSAKFMNAEPKIIELRLTAEPDRVIVEIADNGPGIGPDALPRVFERFYREDASRSESTGGSGLGLAIAKEIIDGHGGTIAATSKPGEGTVVRFSLNRAERSDTKS
ncbi:ATP-binding protein [Cohnella sp. GCM10027633]|uniref:sensor histidine kinase n=1 Tax=unclassified Cohnella TaxID=2636738 RepID=UPI0036395229